MTNSSAGGMILVSCGGSNCKSIIKKAQGFQQVVDVSQARDKDKDIDVIITV
jgi:hypothetical protein